MLVMCLSCLSHGGSRDEEEFLAENLFCMHVRDVITFWAALSDMVVSLDVSCLSFNRAVWISVPS